MPRGQELRPATTKTPGAAFWTNWISRRQPVMGAGPERWWRRPWGMYPNIKSGGCCAPKESIYSGAVAGASVPIRNLPPRRPISLPCTWTRRVDRIILNAYFRMGHSPGGFHVWWRALTGSDDTLDNTHLMRLAGRFSRRLRGYAKAHGIPVIDCPRGERK